MIRKILIGLGLLSIGYIVYTEHVSNYIESVAKEMNNRTILSAESKTALIKDSKDYINLIEKIKDEANKGRVFYELPENFHLTEDFLFVLMEVDGFELSPSGNTYIIYWDKRAIK